MSFRVVRQSKFRHVFGTAAKKEEGFDGARITRNAWDSNFCSVNPKFIAVVEEAQGGGSFIVLPLSQVGRVEYNAPRVCGHKSAVLDVQFNPFNDNMIASAAEDALVMVWLIPDEGLAENMTQPVVTLQGHQRRVGIVEWHPTADNVLLSAGFDYMIIIWDVSKGVAINQIASHADTIYCVSWNFDGSLIATTCKDKYLRIMDARSGAIIASEICHEGSKPARATFLDEDNKVFTCGFSKMSERQLALWDSKLTRLKLENVDTASGVLFPKYDPDTKMVYIYGKGDGNIRYYEIDSEAPYVHALSQYQSSNPQRGVAFMPKRGCNIGECEVALCFKLHPKGFIERIGFTVPRKATQFQEDIFPPTKLDAPVLSAAEWAAGATKPPKLVSLKDGYQAPARAAFVAPEAAAAVPQDEQPPKGEKDLLKAWHEHQAEIKRLKATISTYEIKLRSLGHSI